MKKIKAIIFDLDNTLFDFSSCWLKANEQIFYTYKFPKDISYEMYFEKFKYYNDYFLTEIAVGNMRLRELRNSRLIATMNYFGKKFSEDDAREYYEKMFTYIENNISPNYEVNNELLRIKNNYKLYLLTNGIAYEQRRKLKKLELAEMFDKLYISSETWINKPDRRAFEQIINENNIAPENVLMIGDSYYHDILPALNLGLRAIQIIRKWHLSGVGDQKEHNNKFDDIIDLLKKL